MTKSEISRSRGHIFAGNPWLKWDVSPLLMRPHHCNQGPHQMMITLLRGPHLCWQSLAKSDTEKIKLIIYLHVDSTLLSFINQVFSLVKQQKRKKIKFSFWWLQKKVRYIHFNWWWTASWSTLIKMAKSFSISRYHRLIGHNSFLIPFILYRHQEYQCCLQWFR